MPSRQRLEARLRTRQALIEGMRAWLAARNYDLERGDLRAWFKQWELKQESDRFNLAPPGRLRICRHLLEYARYYGPQLTWRHRAVIRMNAVGALLVGYKNVGRLDAWRVRVKAVLRRVWKAEAQGAEERPVDPGRYDTRVIP